MKWGWMTVRRVWKLETVDTVDRLSDNEQFNDGTKRLEADVVCYEGNDKRLEAVVVLLRRERQTIGCRSIKVGCSRLSGDCS